MTTEIVPAKDAARTENGVVRRREPADGIALGSFIVADDKQLVALATSKANAAADIIEKQKLFDFIEGQKIVNARGWNTLLAFLGLSAHEASVELLADGSWVAAVELVSRSSGEVVARASSMCGPDEPRQAKKPSFARRSMAVTRATVRVCKQHLAWVMALAGYTIDSPDDGDDTVSAPPATRVNAQTVQTIIEAFGALAHPVSRARIEKCSGPLEDLDEHTLGTLRRALKKLKPIEDSGDFAAAMDSLLPENPF